MQATKAPKPKNSTRANRAKDYLKNDLQRTGHFTDFASRRASSRTTQSGSSFSEVIANLRFRKNRKLVMAKLHRLVTVGEAKRWLNTPNALLGGHSPLVEIAGDRTSRVLEILATIEEGIYV